MTKEKISATIDPDRLAAARALSPAGSVSGVLNEALLALIEREQERRWLDAHDAADSVDDLPQDPRPDLTNLPWDD